MKNRLPQFDDPFQIDLYDYQCRLACGELNVRPKAEWLAGGTNTDSRLVNIPIGFGKTEAK